MCLFQGNPCWFPLKTPTQGVPRARQLTEVSEQRGSGLSGHGEVSGHLDSGLVLLRVVASQFRRDRFRKLPETSRDWGGLVWAVRFQMPR